MFGHRFRAAVGPPFSAGRLGEYSRAIISVSLTSPLRFCHIGSNCVPYRPDTRPRTMPSVTVTCHPDGCPPIEAAKAYCKHKDEGMTPDEIVAEGEVLSLSGNVAGRKALYSAIRRIEAMSPGEFVPKTKYGNCGRKQALTDAQTREIVAFVKKWRAK